MPCHRVNNPAGSCAIVDCAAKERASEFLAKEEEPGEDQAPWYRRRDYKGNLTEEEKRELDHFRLLAQQPGGSHPADHNLPEEVNLYISKLKIELHDERGTVLMGRVLLLNGIGVLMLASFFGWSLFKVDHEGSALTFLGGVLFIVVPWFYYSREQKKLGDQLFDYDGRTFEWELNYIAKRRKPEHDDYD